jgi:hypothetical protein
MIMKGNHGLKDEYEVWRSSVRMTRDGKRELSYVAVIQYSNSITSHSHEYETAGLGDNPVRIHFYN